jgi:hypothetical protein
MVNFKNSPPREANIKDEREQLLGFKNSPPLEGWQAQPDGVVLGLDKGLNHA